MYWIVYIFVYEVPIPDVSNLLYELAMLCPVNTMLPVTLEKPTMFLYITITFFHTPLWPGQVME